MDELDKLILEQLLEDSRRSVTEIAKAISLSHSATRIRLVKLVETGVVKRFTIELGEETGDLAPSNQIDRPFKASSAFLHIQLKESQNLEDFSAFLQQIPEISSAYEMGGEFNCMIHLECESPGQLNAVIENLERETSIQAIECQQITGSLPNFVNESASKNQDQDSTDIDSSASFDRSVSASTAEGLESDLLQYEISALEKSTYMDPSDEMKVVRMAVKLVEGSH